MYKMGISMSQCAPRVQVQEVVEGQHVHIHLLLRRQEEINDLLRHRHFRPSSNKPLSCQPSFPIHPLYLPLKGLFLVSLVSFSYLPSSHENARKPYWVFYLHRSLSFFLVLLGPFFSRHLKTSDLSCWVEYQSHLYSHDRMKHHQTSQHYPWCWNVQLR